MAVIYASSNAQGWTGTLSTYSGAAESGEAGYCSEEVAISHISNTGSAICTSPEFTASGDLVWIHCRAKFPTGADNSAADGLFMEFFDSTDDRVGAVDVNNGNLRVQAGDNFDPYGSEWSLSTGTIYTLDILVDTTGSEVTIELYVDEVLVSSVTNASHVTNVPAYFDMIYDFMGVGLGPTDGHYSEWIIDDAASTLGTRLNEMKPASDGTETGMDGDYTDLLTSGDLAVMVGDATELFSWNPAAYGGPDSGETVRAVVAQTEVLTGASGPTGLTQFVRMGGTNYFGTTDVVGLSANAMSMEVWADDPSGGSWTIADLGTMEVGIRADA